MRLAHMCPPKPHRIMAKPACLNAAAETRLFSYHFSITLAEASTP